KGMAAQEKLRFDPNSPQIKAYLDELAHQFVSEGTIVAFPTCLPGMTTPIPHEESRITALDINSDGFIYGGTSGPRAHLFAAGFHQLTGVVLDAGVVAGATSTVSVCCGVSRTIAFVNGDRGGRAVAIPEVKLAQDWIQEWGLDRPELQDVGECVPGEAVVDAVCVPPGNMIVGMTVRHVFTMDVDSAKIALVAEAPGRGHLGLGRTAVFGQDDGERLWRLDIASGHVERGAVELPAGAWSGSMRWARAADGELFTADDDGRLFAFDEKKGFRAIGKTHLTPVGPIAVAPDGRLFGVCGTEIANLFCCDARSGSVTNLGVVASIFQQRRYGYVFGAAITGPEGEIVLGEDDNSGHIWLYFPRIAAQA
ncbi:MAG TPA: hypothetical protein VMF66_10970, partial [Candidatus Acidoferrum sp.]|nr:hypothetical protein [Candidatus Acidoferrum sp.]